jgi:hypothetical protein
MSDTILILMVQGTFHLHGNYQRTFHGIHVWDSLTHYVQSSSSARQSRRLVRPPCMSLSYPSCLRRFQFLSLFSLKFSSCMVYLIVPSFLHECFFNQLDSPPRTPSSSISLLPHLLSYSFSFSWRLLPIWQCNCLIFCSSCSTGWNTCYSFYFSTWFCLTHLSTLCCDTVLAMICL